MVRIMLANNINVLNAVILPILNGIVPSTCVEPANKQHRDMHHKHVMDASIMMGFEAITM
jgi:hypothetical protein